LINLKWSGIAGGAGFVISLLVGLISGAGFPLLLIRAVIFGLLFFVLGGGAWLLINNFVPELLFPGEGETDLSEEIPRPGSRVDISVGGGPDSALPEKYGFSGSEDEVGDIADLLSGKIAPENNTAAGMDQNREDGYTKNSGVEFQTEGNMSNPGFSAMPGGDIDSPGVLPDLDSMVEAFAPVSAEPAESPVDISPPARSPSGNKPQSLKGDFNPKDLAAAIRTKISKE
jgi:hypothetical protein